MKGFRHSLKGLILFHVDLVALWYMAMPKRKKKHFTEKLKQIHYAKFTKFTQKAEEYDNLILMLFRSFCSIK